MVDSINREYGKELIYELEIDDPVEENYYEVLVLDRVKTFIYDPDLMEYIWSMDPVLIRANLNTEDLLVEEFQQFGQSFVFNDKLFNGNHYKFTFGPSHTVYNGNIGDNYESVYFILRNVSREYYLYKRSFALHEWVQGNPFAEPVPVFTNIENGFGIFAGFNQVVEEFEFH